MYDIRITAEQLKAAAAWVAEGENIADVELLADDRMLVVSQGDDRAAFDTGGEPGSDEYVSLAPLDRPDTPFAELDGRSEAAAAAWRRENG